ncbi:MAG: hypothetical protein ACRDS0_34495 [Pseudonocardiaceae bacterium]
MVALAPVRLVAVVGGTWIPKKWSSTSEVISMVVSSMIRIPAWSWPSQVTVADDGSGRLVTRQVVGERRREGMPA